MPNHEKGHPLEENPNWEGGRTVTSHGYVLLKRPEHPDADVRGYVYEHRLVAEEMLGRPLEEDEQVHHKNGDRQDNREENLEVVTIAEHRKRHRERDELRDPGEPNPVIECACGCGRKFRKYDETNRPREYIPGHNSRDRDAPVQEQMLKALGDGPKKTKTLVEEVDTTEAGVKSALGILKQKEQVKNPRHGWWALPEQEVPGLSKKERVESDEEIECACGCGRTLTRYDDYGREREYITGHNTIDRPSPVEDEVLEILREAGSPVERSTLEDRIEATDSSKSIGSALRRLRDKGIVEDAGYGKWEISSQTGEM